MNRKHATFAFFHRCDILVLDHAHKGEPCVLFFQMFKRCGKCCNCHNCPFFLDLYWPAVWGNTPALRQQCPAYSRSVAELNMSGICYGPCGHRTTQLERFPAQMPCSGASEGGFSCNSGLVLGPVRSWFNDRPFKKNRFVKAVCYWSPVLWECSWLQRRLDNFTVRCQSLLQVVTTKGCKEDSHTVQVIQSSTVV